MERILYKDIFKAFFIYLRPDKTDVYYVDHVNYCDNLFSFSDLNIIKVAKTGQIRNILK